MTRLPKLHDGYVNSLLRGLAIVAVLMIHTLSSIHGGYNPTSAAFARDIALDRLGRFSVPLFVALSGFGFWQKYQKTHFHWLDFLWKQTSKLLPLYVLASAVFYVAFSLHPQWKPFVTSPSFFIQLLRGKADYHLYFVPMIFQFYLLFPIVAWIVRKAPWISLGVAALFQVVVYLIMSSQTPGAFVTKYLLTDQQQYVWFFSWIFYFVLGMHLPAITRAVEQQRLLLFALFVPMCGALLWSMYRSSVQITSGIDPIIVLRFTYIDVLLYCAFMIPFLMSVAELTRTHVRHFTKPLRFLGRFSYHIYLFHTLLLRFIFNLN